MAIVYYLYNMTLQERIREKRLSDKISVKDMAERLSISRSFYWRIETGKRKPLDKILQACDILGINNLK